MKRIALSFFIVMLLFCLAGCGKTQPALSAPAELNDPAEALLGIYAIGYEGETGSGEYYVDIRMGEETLLYSIQQGKQSSLAPADSFDRETGRATASFSMYIKDREVSVLAELTFISGDDGVVCSGSCAAVYGDGTEESFALSGKKLWNAGEQPGN